MGRNGHKPLTSSYLKLNIFKIPRVVGGEGYYSITWGEGEDQKRINAQTIFDDRPRLVLDYKTREYGETEWTPRNYPVYLERTACNFGGNRTWFKCPRCNRRCAMLYSHSSRFICRTCLGCAYPSQNENRRGFWGIIGVAIDYEKKAEKLYDGVRWQTKYKGAYTKRCRKYMHNLYLYNGNAQNWLALEEKQRHQRAKIGVS